MDRLSAHIDRAWDFISKGNGFKALLAARQALVIDEDSPEVHNLLGCIYAMDGDFLEALSCYQKAIDLDEDYLDPVLNAAEVFLHSKEDADEAIRYCELARSMIESEEELVEVILLEADAMMNKGEADAAREKLMSLDDSAPLTVAQHILVGRFFYELGDFDHAERFIERALERAPSDADARYGKGLLLREQGNRVDAVRIFISVLEDDMSRPVPPWLDEPGAADRLVAEALERLDDSAKMVLRGAEIVVAPLPTREQVCLEMDPRHAVFAEGVNPEAGAFRRLWMFYQNFDHIRMTPQTAVDDLVELIQNEVLCSQGQI